jgi:hypothetical protein
MPLLVIRIVLAASSALLLWHILVISQILDLVRHGLISIITFSIPFSAPIGLLAGALVCRRYPKSARLLFVVSAAFGLAAASVLPLYWPRYLPIPLLALLGLAASEMHNVKSRTTDSE